MEKFTKLTGLVAPMDRANVDTDQIIPKQFLKRIERTGFGQFLFFDWRFNDDGSDNPDFELNRPQYRGANILVTRRNFGSGSSREHAPWALDDYGFRVVIAPSFADIFYNNCFKNGMLPIVLSDANVDELFERCAKYPGYKLTADLESCKLTDEHGLSLPIEVEAFRRHCLLNGLDDIGLTLQQADKITAFEKARGMALATVEVNMSESRRTRIESLLALDPGDQFLRYSLAMELEKEGDHERSLANFSELQKDASPYVPAFFMAAQQLVKLNRIPEARDALRRGIEEARRQNTAHAAGEMSELLASLGSAGE